MSWRSRMMTFNGESKYTVYVCELVDKFGKVKKFHSNDHLDKIKYTVERESSSNTSGCMVIDTQTLDVVSKGVRYLAYVDEEYKCNVPLPRPLPHWNWNETKENGHGL